MIHANYEIVPFEGPVSSDATAAFFEQLCVNDQCCVSRAQFRNVEKCVHKRSGNFVVLQHCFVKVSAANSLIS